MAYLDVEFSLDQKLRHELHQLLFAELADAIDHHAMLFGDCEIHETPPHLIWVTNIERGASFLASGIALSKTRNFAILKTVRQRQPGEHGALLKMGEAR